MNTDVVSDLCRGGVVAALAIGVTACGSPTLEVPAASATGGGNWSVTAWGARFEVFPEVGALVVGETSVSHTHVTRLDGFAPLVDGAVEIVLSGPSGKQTFSADVSVRPGIFAVEIEPRSPGHFDLSFRVSDPRGSEEIRGGKIRVGTAEQPGGLVVAPVPKGATNAGEPLAFLKEEQWRSDFATAWVRSGRLARSVAGLARIRPPAGGEVIVTSPVDGVLLPASGSRRWPFVGLPVDRGDSFFRVAPRVAADRSLAALEADLAGLTSELTTARGRLARLEELLDLEAASRREVEEAKAAVDTLGARHSAAERDLESARASREGGVAGKSLSLRAPIAGVVASVSATPGGIVEAGEALARVVRTDALWIEIAVSPAGARQLSEEGVRGVVLTDPEVGSTRIEDNVRLVSVAPETSPETGTVTVLLEVAPSAGLILGATLEAQVLADREREGIVIPASALVDDGGVAVVYLQLSGESFVRQVVDVLDRQGDLLLVDALVPGQRLVIAGGEAVRRSSLMASGTAHGHVH